ncbi:MAG: GAF domain-containing protein [Chloroflexota bacterium]|nr:GAF domain-containing protein [Chloroflexota bacterium]
MNSKDLFIPSQTLAADLQEMQILHNLSLQLVSEDNIQVFYEALLSAAIALTHADAGSVQMLDEERQTLRLLASHGFSSRFLAYFAQVDASSPTSCGVALDTGVRAFIDFDDPHIHDEDGALRLHLEAGYLSAQSTPLVTRSGEAIGMFSTHWRTHYRPDERELRSLDLLARPAADLIERADSQSALRKSEEKYRSLFESIDAGFCVIEMLFDEQQTPIDYRFLEVNPAFERQTGLHGAAGQWVRDLVPGLERHWFEMYGKVALTGEASRFENSADPMQRSFDVYAFRVGEASERRVAILFNDITYRKRREASATFLAEISNDFSRLTTTDEIISVVGAKIGSFLHVSRCLFINIDDVTHTAVITHDWHVAGMPNISGPEVYRIRDFFTDPLYQVTRAGETVVVYDALADPRIPIVEPTLALGIRAYITVPIIKDGHWRFVFSISTPVPRDWQPHEIEFIEELATRIWLRLERARAEEAARETEQRRLMAVEAGGVGDWDFNLVTGEIYWSPRMYALHGLPDGMKMTLDLIAQHTHPDDAPVVLEVHKQAITGANDGKYIGQYRITHPDRQVRWLESRGNVVFDERDGQQVPVRVMGTVMDITARKLVEGIELDRRVLAEVLRDTAEELGSTLKLQDVLEHALSAAHELVSFDAGYIVLTEQNVMTHFQGEALTLREEQMLTQWHRSYGTLSELPLYQLGNQRRKVMLINDERQLKQTLPLRSLKAVFLLPIATAKEMFGYMVLINRSHNGFGDADVAALQAFAYQLTTAISNAQLFVQAQELAALKERQQFARELHDAVSQTLFTASIMTESLPRLWEQQSTKIPDLLADISRLIRGAQAEMRTLLLELRPANLETTPLKRLLEQLIDALRGRKHTDITLTFDGEPVLPVAVHIIVYRIAQEALNNITKHAYADKAWVVVRGDKGFVELSIQDNGVGFSLGETKTGLGLQMMRERAHEIDALLDIDSHLGEGTRLRLQWPRGSQG